MGENYEGGAGEQGRAGEKNVESESKRGARSEERGAREQPEAAAPTRMAAVFRRPETLSCSPLSVRTLAQRMRNTTDHARARYLERCWRSWGIIAFTLDVITGWFGSDAGNEEATSRAWGRVHMGLGFK
eukprot:2186437-Rhodomonas_salina.2